jgi:tryptophan-rich sensory protein
MDSTSPRLPRILAAIVLVGAAMALGNVATIPNLVPWYRDLAKPAFNPPNWIFGPVWTLLYVLMGVALYRLLGLPRSLPGRNRALQLFAGQLALNVAWSWGFFALHAPAHGLIDIVPQLLLVLASAAAAWRVDRPAAWCLVPLAFWVTFATLLNGSIWLLNS